MSFREVFNWEEEWILIALKFASHTAMSVFVGLMSYHFAVALSLLPGWQLPSPVASALIPVAVGIGAWRGAKTLQMLEKGLRALRPGGRTRRRR